MQTKWNLDHIAKNVDDKKIEDSKKQAQEQIKEFVDKWAKDDSYLTDPTQLKKSLDDYSDLLDVKNELGDIPYYLYLKIELNSEDKETTAKLKSVEESNNKESNKMMFYVLNLSKIKEKDQKIFLADKNLSSYWQFLKHIFKTAKYNLSEKEEQLFNLLRDPASSNWVDLTSKLISKEEVTIIDEDNKKVKIPVSQVSGYIDSQNKKTRDSAFNAYTKIAQKYSEIAEHEFNSILQTKRVSDDLRKHSRGDASRLISDDIEPAIIDALIQAVSENFSVVQDYYKFKAQLFNKKKLAYNERNLPLEAVNKKIKFEEAFDLVHKTFEQIDPEFASIAQNLLDEGFIDVYPQKGKADGAYCIHNSLHSPIYVLLNYNDRLNDVTTIAHELGHAINNVFMKKNRTPIDHGTPTGVAEVSSTFFEDFVLEELTKKADKKTQLALLIQKIDDSVSTIFRQISFYKFEQDLHKLHHEKSYVTKDEINALYRKNMHECMGNSVQMPKKADNLWVMVSHFRRMFYVYSYASGLLISKSMQSKFRKDKNFVKPLKQFLEAGYSKSTKQIFEDVGIDITQKEFWIQGIDQIKSEIAQAKALFKEIK